MSRSVPFLLACMVLVAPACGPAETQQGEVRLGAVSGPGPGQVGSGGDATTGDAGVTELPCVPACEGKDCGDDGCGGTCGTCVAPDLCNGFGACVCLPQCDGKVCGDDGCGDVCGTCQAPSVCTPENTCVCFGSCEGKICGDDGCGVSCGACPDTAPFCDGTGACFQICEPACGSKACGADGCGGVCGQCPEEAAVCTTAGECVPECIPSCEGKTCGDDGCGGSCGLCPCEPEEVRCSGPLTLEVCASDGAAWVEEPCPDGEGCADDQCIPQVCEPGANMGACFDLTTYGKCDPSGTAVVPVTCSDETACDGGLCSEVVCEPGELFCIEDTLVTCNAPGTGPDNLIPFIDCTQEFGGQGVCEVDPEESDACVCVPACDGKVCSHWSGCLKPGEELILCAEVNCDLTGEQTCWEMAPLGLEQGDGCLTRPEACALPAVECGFLTDVYEETVDCGSLAGKVCQPGWTCPDGGNVCECVPDCSGLQCGVDHCDVPCGDFNGECPGPQDICNGQQQCECVPLCEDKACGQDGCGGLCPNLCGPGDQFLCEEETNTCLEIICAPGELSCVEGVEQLQICGSNGTFWIPDVLCPEESICLNAECLGPCQQSTVKGSYIGCDFWAVDLDNIEESEAAPVGLVVSVPSTSGPTDVVITNTTTGQTLGPGQLGVGSNKVASGSVKVFTLPGGKDLDGSSLGTGSYHVATSYPTTVHQFNPLNGEGVYTNDASLLLPAEVTGQTYYVMSWPHRKEEAFTLRGFATVVATQEGDTNVLVVPTATITAGAGVETLAPNASHSFTLEKGEVLNLETEGDTGVDLTGTYVQGDQKISVFGGHECANVPQGINACDHLEQQLLPLETWSTTYIADAFAKRSPTQVDVWRVMSGGPNVTVTTTPPVPGYETFKLQGGQWVQFATAESFQVKADGPIQVGHLLTGSTYPGSILECQNTGVGNDTAIGDPAFTLAPPTDRFLTSYSVLTPSGFQKNFLNVVIPVGVPVLLDGQPLDGDSTPIPNTLYSVTRESVSPGVHTLTASVPFGLTVYGYDCDVSYAYPGGLNLQAGEAAVGVACDEDPCQSGCDPLGCLPEPGCDQEEICDGQDNNCNLLVDEGCDDDGDGYCSLGMFLEDDQGGGSCPFGEGDCYDYSPDMSPASDEVPGDGLDNDCNGVTDPETNLNIPCEGQTCLGTSTEALLCAMEICTDTVEVISSVVESPTESDISQSYEAIAHLGSPDNGLAPYTGDSYVAMATGPIEISGNGQDLAKNEAGDSDGSLNDPYSPIDEQMHDVVEFSVTMVAPAEVTGFSIDYIFMSQEYEEYIGSKYNDRFYMILGSEDSGEASIINFTQCSNPEGYVDFEKDGEQFCYIAINSAFSEPCLNQATDISGTGYEPKEPSFPEGEGPGVCGHFGGSSTGWLTTTWPIDPGEAFTLTFHIHDTGDGALDSLVLIDNFTWEGAPVTAGTGAASHN